MSVSISIAEVIANVESRLRIPTCTTITAFTAAEMLTAVQEAVKSLYALARERMGEEFDTLLDTSLATVANTSNVSLAAVTNFGELYRLVWVVDSTTQPIELNETPVHYFEPPGFRPRAWARSGADKPSYRLTGTDTLRLTPCPNAIYPLHCWYTAHTPVTSATDVIQGRLEWNRWIEADVCWRACSGPLKRPDAASVHVAERNAMASSIFSPGRERAPEARRVIRDVESFGGRVGFDRKTGEFF